MSTMTTNTQILIITNSLNVGGTEMHLATVLPQLAGRGLRIAVLLLRDGGPLVPKFTAVGIDVINPPYKLASIQNKLLRGLALGMNVLNAAFTMLRLRPKVIHFYLPEAYLIGGMLGVLLHQQNMLMSRRSLNYYQYKYPRLAKLEHYLHQKMRWVLGNSKACVQQLIQVEGVTAAKTKLIYNGVDLQQFAAADLTEATEEFRTSKQQFCQEYAKFGVTENTVILVIVANLIPYKAHDLLLIALAKVKSKLPADWRLVCVGADSANNLQLLQKLAANLNIADNIIWVTNKQGNVAPLLLAADIGILCSQEEGFANAILEYMAAKLPVIATDVGGNSEAVVAAGAAPTGIIVPANNPDALGSAIVTLATNLSDARELGQNGYDRVVTHFSLDKCVADYHALYESIV
jgi:glycosyltransferase involved in cell wall biosynthesis